MTYNDGAAFRRALEDRLREQSRQSGAPLVRLRKLVAFDRLLARLVRAQPRRWMLKGGLALQLRLGPSARTTKDMDLLMMVPRLEQGSVRLFTSAYVEGRLFESFHVDVSSSDPVVEPAESLTSAPLLAFAGISPAVIPCYPLTQHLAEKVHAYVRPRSSGTNTIVKDLVDILLILERAAINGGALRLALQATFAADGESNLPSLLPEPPSSWSSAFQRLADDVGLDCGELHEAIVAARRFLKPVLSGDALGVWQPDAQIWE